MNVDKLIFFLAGIVILVSLLLYLVHSPYWLILVLIVGIDLVQAPFTGFCPMAKVLRFFRVKPGSVFK